MVLSYSKKIQNTLNDLVTKSGKIHTFTADYTIRRLIDLTGNIYNLLDCYEQYC